MREFYQGCRRTYGAALLICSGVLMLAWLRSSVVADEFLVEATFSGDHEVSQFYRSNDHAMRLICRVRNAGTVREEELMAIPYAPIALPTVLLSAFLILWKPRNREA